MADTTNFALPLLETNDTYSEADFQRLLKSFDRTVGEYLQLGAKGGVISGWVISTDKEVGAGEAIVNGCHCITVAATDISSGLSNGVENFIYADTNSTSAPDGTVAFGSVTAVGSIPSTAIQLGSITLNAGGTATAADDNPSDCLRDYLKAGAKYRIIPVQTVYQELSVGSSVVLEIDHSDIQTFNPANNVYIDADPKVNVHVLGDGLTGSVFRVKLVNNWTEAYGELYDDDAYGYDDEDTVRFCWQRDGWV